MANFNSPLPKGYQLVDLESGLVINIWGDSTGGIAFRVMGNHVGNVHHLDDDTILQQKILGAILAYWKNNRLDSIGRGIVTKETLNTIDKK